MLDPQIEAKPFDSLDLLFSDISDADLEAAAGDSRGLFCSCSGCNSACSNDSRP